VIILIADDEAGVRRLVARMIVRRGHTCLEASGGNEALRLYTEKQPQAVISDVNLGDADGVDICLRLRRQAPQTAIAIMTGDQASVVRACRAGFHLVMRKPFTLKKLERLLERLEEEIR